LKYHIQCFLNIIINMIDMCDTNDTLALKSPYFSVEHSTGALEVGTMCKYAFFKGICQMCRQQWTHLCSRRHMPCRGLQCKQQHVVWLA